MTAGALFTLVIYLLVVGVLIALVSYIVRAVPIPDPLGRIIVIAVVVIGVLIVVMVLLQMIGVGAGPPLLK
jgi:hypothetical protein